jgi:hypothetical protein
MEAFLAVLACLSCSPINGGIENSYSKKTGQPVKAGTGRIKSLRTQTWKNQAVASVVSVDSAATSFSGSGAATSGSGTTTGAEALAAGATGTATASPSR